MCLWRVTFDFCKSEIIVRYLAVLQVVEDAPYVTTVPTLDEYEIDFCVHGGKKHSMNYYLFYPTPPKANKASFLGGGGGCI